MSTIKHTSEFMKNQRAADILPAQSQFKALQTHTGNALFFSIGDTEILYLSAEKNGSYTGWQSIDLFDQLKEAANTTDIKPRQFSVSQNPQDGRIHIAAVLNVGDSTSDQLYIMSGLPCHEESDWLDPEKKEARTWTARPFETPSNENLTLSYTHLAKTSQAGEAPLLLVGVLQENTGTIQNYTVDTDTGKTSDLWTYFQTAEDYTEMLSLKMGRAEYSEAPGIYELYSRGNKMSLTFTPTHGVFGPPTILKLTPPEGASALAVRPQANSENTDLYVAGDGVIKFYTVQEQTKFAEGTTILSNKLIKDIDKLLVHSLEDKLVLVGNNRMGELFYSQCSVNEADNEDSWSVPVPIKAGIEQITSYLNQQTGGHEIFAHVSGQQIERYSQDTTTTQWNSASILLESTDKMVEFNSYTTHITLSDESEIPMPEKEIKITASSDCAVYVNHKYTCFEKGIPRTLKTDQMGKLSITQKAEGLRCINFTVSHEETEFVSVYPMNEIHSRINESEDLSDIQITDEYGKTTSLIPESATQEEKESLALVLDSLKEIKLDESGKVIEPPANSLPTPFLWGVSHKNGECRYFEHEEAMTGLGLKMNADGTYAMHTDTIHLDDIMNDSIELLVGDFFSWIRHAFEDVVQHVLAFMDNAYHFFIEIGGVLYRCAIKVLGDVLDAVEFVFNKILIGIEKLIQWVGYILGWDDIIKYKEVFRHMAELCKDKAKAEIGNLEGKVVEGVAYLEKIIDEFADLDTSGSVFNNKLKDSSGMASEKDPDAASTESNPVLNWLTDHIFSNLEIIRIDPEQLEDLLQEIINSIKDVVATDVEILENALKSAYEEVICKVGELSLPELLKKLVAIIGKSVLELAGELVIGLLQAGRIIIDAIWLIMTAEINIPVITSLYKGITGSEKLTLLDVGCLMAAIPAEIACKLLGMGSPSDEAMERFLNTTTLDEFIQALAAEKFTGSDNVRFSPACWAVGKAMNLSPATTNKSGYRLEYKATGLDWVYMSGEYANVLLFTGIVIGDLCQFAAETADSTGISTSFLKVSNALRTGCYFIQQCFVGLRTYCWAALQLGLEPFNPLGCVALTGLIIGATIIGALGTTMMSFIEKINKTLLKIIAGFISVLNGFIAITVTLVSAGFGILNSILMITHMKERYGDDTQGGVLFGLDESILVLVNTNMVLRAVVVTTLPINMLASLIFKDPGTKVAVQAGCAVAICLCGLTPPMISLVIGSLDLAVIVQGYALV